jgi:hypothetical protein
MRLGAIDQLVPPKDLSERLSLCATARFTNPVELVNTVATVEDF